MGTSIQSQAFTHNEKQPRKPDKGSQYKRNKPKDIQRPQKSDMRGSQKESTRIQDLDDDYDDGNIPDESEITKKLDQNSSRFKTK